MDKKYIRLEDILLNEPRDLEIPGIGVVKIRDPTVGDRIEAKRAAMEHPLWDKMTEEERGSEIQRQLALRMLVEPKITKEQYLQANDPLLFTILDTVIIDYVMRLKALSDKRQKILKDFLEVMKEGGPLNITRY
jgi:hypothetical protein